MPQHTQNHLRMLTREWPTITARLREAVANTGRPARDFAVGLLHRDDDVAKGSGNEGLPELAVLIMPREDLAGTLADFQVGDIKPYDAHANAVLEDPEAGRIHAFVFAGNEATRTQVAYA